MEAFKTLTGVAAPLIIDNIDTDMIIPKQFLKTVKRSGLGKNLFDEMRYDENGQEITSFVLNKQEYKDTKILVSGKNFGCGSSREHAPWALLDFGIRCIIAEDFADIFYNNTFKNGVLPIALSKIEVEKLQKDAANRETFTINLEEQEITTSSGIKINFEIDSFRKYCLIEGLDDIGLTLKDESKISQFEEKQKIESPWLYS